MINYLDDVLSEDFTYVELVEFQRLNAVTATAMRFRLQHDETLRGDSYEAAYKDVMRFQRVADAAQHLISKIRSQDDFDYSTCMTKFVFELIKG